MTRTFDIHAPYDGPGDAPRTAPPADGIDRTLLQWFATLTLEERLAWLDDQQQFVVIAATATRARSQR